MASIHEIKFYSSGGGKSAIPPDPRYPLGKKLVMVKHGQNSCTVDLPMASEIGYWRVKCVLCELSFAVSVFGRADDVNRVVVPCNIQINQEGEHDSGP